MRIFVFICCLLPLIAAAEKAAKRTCRILFLEAPQSAPQKLFLFDGTAYKEVELPSMNFSQVYEISEGTTRVCMLPAPVVNPEQIPTDAPQASLPKTTKDCYLILTSDPANKVAPVRIQVVNSGTDLFTNGQMLWFNLTGYDIGGHIGTESLRIPPNSRKVLNSPAPGATSYSVKIAYMIPAEKVLRPICQTQWQHNPATRMVVFVFNQGESKVPRVMGFSDFRLSTSEKDTAP